MFGINAGRYRSWKREKMWKEKKFPGADFEIKKKFRYSGGYGSWIVCFFTKQRWRYDVQGGHDAEKRCAAHVMRGPRSCSVVSAGDLSGP